MKNKIKKIEITQDGNGKITYHNDGFSQFELIGIFAFHKDMIGVELLHQVIPGIVEDKAKQIKSSLKNK